MNKHEQKRFARRRRRERAFRLAAAGALAIAGTMFVVLAAGVVVLGHGAFVRHGVVLEVDLDPEILNVDRHATAALLRTADFREALLHALSRIAGEPFDAKAQRERMMLLSPGAEFLLADLLARKPALLGGRVRLTAPLSSSVDQYLKGKIDAGSSTDPRLLTQFQLDTLARLQQAGVVRWTLNFAFFLNGDSSYPELAGIAAGVIGSLIAVGLALLIAAPLGVSTAIFLEEFAPKNALTDFLEININNLAAIPSIIFGLLGLVVFVQTFELPRSAPLVGGMVLALMTLPTIIISTRTSLRALPSSLKEGALALGASRLRAIADPLLPAAAPGIVTGVIISFARALGETAPLILIGMVAFVATPPASVLAPSSALPVLIYLWAESPETGFAEKTAGAVIVLLVILLALNYLAAEMRRRLEPHRR